MKTQHIIAILVVLALAGAGGAGYQFYFKAKLQQYADDKVYLEQLDAKLKSLKSQFPTGKPAEDVAAVVARKQPWQEAVELRVRHFGLPKGFKEVNPLPETLILRAYYSQESQRIIEGLQREAYSKGVWLNPAIDLYFGMPSPSTLVGQSVSDVQAKFWLTYIQFGVSLLRYFIDARVLGIEDISIWTPKVAEGFTTYTVGVSLWLTLEDLCKLLENIQLDDRTFIKVHGLSITNTQLAIPEPALKVNMILQIEEFNQEETPPPAAASPNRTASAQVGAGSAGAGG
jgi:hypothetical protein